MSIVQGYKDSNKLYCIVLYCIVLHSISTYGVLHSRTLEIALQGTRNSTVFWSAALHLHKGKRQMHWNQLWNHDALNWQQLCLGRYHWATMGRNHWSGYQIYIFCCETGNNSKLPCASTNYIKPNLRVTRSRGFNASTDINNVRRGNLACELCLQLNLVALISGIDKNYKSFVGILDYLVVNTTGYSL